MRVDNKDMTTWLDKKLDESNDPAAPTTPSRAIGTAFQPSTTGYTFCSYSVQQIATHGQDGTIQLLSDSANPPTTVRAQARLAVSDDEAGATTNSQLVHIVPPGHYVKLVASGTGTNSVTAQVETIIS